MCAYGTEFTYVLMKSLASTCQGRWIFAKQKDGGVVNKKSTFSPSVSLTLNSSLVRGSQEQTQKLFCRGRARVFAKVCNILLIF